MKALLMTKSDIERTITRISYEVIERNKTVNDLVVIGVKTRGILISEMLSKKISTITNSNVPFFPIDVKKYRDDINKEEAKLYNENDIRNEEIQEKRIILVDDVLYTGRTIRAAINAILDIGRPKNIQLAVLIDRGHRELPIRADYIGKNIPTSKEEIIKVNLKPIDNEDNVSII